MEQILDILLILINQQLFQWNKNMTKSGYIILIFSRLRGVFIQKIWVFSEPPETITINPARAVGLQDAIALLSALGGGEGELTVLEERLRWADGWGWGEPRFNGNIMDI